MDSLLSIAKLFVSANVEPKNFQEDFISASFLMESQIVVPLAEDLSDAYAWIPAGDVLHVDVSVGNNDPVSFHSTRPDQVAAQLDFLQRILKTAGNSLKCKLRFVVDKAETANVNVYKLIAFQQWLENLSLRELLSCFGDRLGKFETVQFVCEGLAHELNSETISFRKAVGSPVKANPTLNRESLIKRRNELCHFEHGSEIQVIPEDFFLIRRSTHPITKLFDRLCAALCVIFVADVSRFEGDGSLSFKLKGYKSITGAVDWANLSGTSAEVLFKVYRWIYEGGIAADKAGLARNLISLHTKQSDITNVDEELYNSITSGYQIYLKENVKQYIEIKNKLIEFLTELSKKAAKLGEDLGNTLAKNFVAFVSFFLSVLVVKAIADKDFSGSFSPKVATIAYALLVASLVHLVASILMLNREIRVMGTGYENIRKRYSDLLDKQDLNAVFNNNDEYNLTIGTIKFKRGLFGGLWLVYLIIFALLIAHLSQDKQRAIGSPAEPTTNIVSPQTATNIATVTNAPTATRIAPDTGNLPTADSSNDSPKTKESIPEE